MTEFDDEAAEMWVDSPDDAPPYTTGDGEALLVFSVERLAAIRAEAKIEALEEYADELTWVQPEVSPCAPNFESCCGSEESCDAMRPSVRVVGAVSLRLRAAALRAAQPTEGES